METLAFITKKEAFPCMSLKAWRRLRKLKETKRINKNTCELIANSATSQSFKEEALFGDIQQRKGNM